MNDPLVIWQLGDGKPGHENQSLGLIEAIGRYTPVARRRIELAEAGGAISRIRAAFRQTAAFPTPHLIVGAGHATHLPLLALSRKRNTRGIVLMKPSLPVAMFDLCLIPRHDLNGSDPAENVIPTIGALNRVRPQADVVRAGGLILLGGPSRSHDWDTEGMLAAIETLVTATDQPWTLTDSRRTPDGVRETILERFPQIQYFAYEQTPGAWLPGRLAESAEVWVSEDSVSMIYEALSSGAKVGLLAVPRKRAAGRVIRGVDALVEEGLITPYEAWRSRWALPSATVVLAEADRCAALIMERWFTRTE